MRNQEISAYIAKLNNGTGKETIFTRPLSKNVDLGKVWEKLPKPTDEIISNSGPYTIFFIKSDDGKYVGAVLDMYNDLHWFIKPLFRKKGYLSKALKSTILPYLFYEREEQKVTIDINQIGEHNYSNSKRVVELLGFKKIETDRQEEVYVLSKTDFDWSNELLEEENSKIGRERIDVLRKRAYYAANLLWMIQNELETKYGDCNELDEVVKEARNYTWKIEDLLFEYEKHRL
jgi:hypothetical protein